MRIRVLAGVACTLGTLPLCMPAWAGENQLGEDASVAWTVKGALGTAMRVQSANKDLLFAPDVPSGGQTNSAVADDGNMNYDAGDLVNGVAQLFGRFDFKYRNYGAVISAKAWYDYVLKEQDVPHGHFPNDYQPDTPLNDDDFDRRARFSGGNLQEAYVYGNFEVNGRPLSVKVGDQFLMWGRSLYSRGSLSSLNAVDLAALHRPGSGYQEYLIPSGMVSLEFSPFEHLSAKAFYQYDWEKAVLDGCGTFYSSLDNTAIGCNGTFSGSTPLPSQDAKEQDLYFVREGDDDARGNGQYGFKFDYQFAKARAKVGAYYFNYHMRLPIYSTRKLDTPSAQPAPFNQVHYFYEYPEDIKVFGLTADKTFAGIGNLSMNLSYLKDMPIQINTSDLTSQTASSTLGGNNAKVPSGTQDYINGVASGDVVHGYREFDIQRAEFTFTTVIPEFLKAQKTVLSLQTAFEWIPDLPSTSEMRFRRHTQYGVGDPGDKGYVTDFSWGYQVSVKSTYANLIGPVTVTPGLSFRHGVDGYASDDALQEDQRSLGLSLGFDYRNTTTTLSYTTYNDQAYSTVSDRDYVALSTSVTF